ncbi:androgen-dependent TFPI-regulating protein-like isoform X2 [Euwallacea similis]|uniref:androgen-dependent TFPI-regulating protein-like isoform X2 n=1 Tax=Euwallacea similis TaxID=1736056 RepID=UPI00344E37EE
MVFSLNQRSNMSGKYDTMKYHHEENSDNDEDIGLNITDLGPIDYPQGEHRLQHAYCLWFSKRPSQVQDSQNYSQALRLIGQVGTVEQWWALYSHIIRLSDIPAHRDLQLFKKGIKPMWEDPSNKKGGKWVLQCVFLTVAIADEVSKLINFSIVQSYTEKIRHFLFSSLVFPNSLLVISVFWSIWFIDRELIFPRIIDEFYPWWLNHTLHTFIIIPLIIEVVVRFKNSNVRISRRKIAIVLIAFCSIYQTLFLTVYVVHGVWLYPIYKVLTWIQRVGFSLLQLFLGLVYQQIGLFLLEGQEKGKAKIK